MTVKQLVELFVVLGHRSWAMDSRDDYEIEWQITPGYTGRVIAETKAKGHLVIREAGEVPVSVDNQAKKMEGEKWQKQNRKTW